MSRREGNSGKKGVGGCFWFHNRFVQVSCWLTTNILIQFPADLKMNHQFLVQFLHVLHLFTTHSKCQDHLVVCRCARLCYICRLDVSRTYVLS